MANQRVNYEDRNYPKKKVNRTIIFTNSAKRKNASAVSNHRSVLSQQRELQTQTFQEEHTTPCTSEHLSQLQTSVANITLMDTTNASNHHTSNAVNTEKNEPTFLFNFESTNAGTRKKKPYQPNKLRTPNKENGLPATNQSNAPICEEISDINSATKNAVAGQTGDDLSIPNRTKQKPDVFKKFENIDISTIYPERLESLFPPFGIQKRMGGVWYCLICNLKSLTFRTLKQHVESEKHGNAAEVKRSKLNSYIDFWAAQPEDCKKYQILFDINGEGEAILKCSKCSVRIKDNEYTNHILICKPKKKKYQKPRKSKIAKQNGGANQNLKDGEVAPIEPGNKNVDEATDNANNVNEAAGKVEQSVAGPSKKQRENKKRAVPKSHEIICRGVSQPWSRIIPRVSARYDRHYRCFKKYTDDKIQCLACEMDIEFDIVPLLVHLASKDHHKKSGLYKNFWMYTCFVCDVEEIKSESEFWCHRYLDDKHKEKVEQVTEDRLKSLGEYECRSCKLIMFGDGINITAHAEAPIMKRKTKDKIPVPTELDQAVIDLFTSRGHIESVALELLNDVKEALELEYQVDQVIADLQNTLRPFFPKVKAYPFGSRITGICNKGSDLDVYIDIQSNYYGANAVHRTNIIQEIKRSLANSKQIWDDIFSIPAARTPIIQLRHIPTEIDIDLSFQNGLSVENTKFLRLCMDLQPKLRPLTLLLKLVRTMTKTKLHITTYALCMMAIFKMQIDGHLIPVTYLRHLNEDAMANINDDKTRSVTGWTIIDYQLSPAELKEYILPVTCDVFDLLKGFFEYYASFDYNKMICPLMGEVINMDDWFEDNVAILPDTMDVYKEKVYNGLIPHSMFGYRYPITVQDPFDMSHNLTKCINKSDLKVWIANCQLMFDYLTKL